MAREPHPEDTCEQCGRPNIVWFSPEWIELVGTTSGILCPSCFGALDLAALWKVTRYVSPDADEVGALTEFLGAVTDLGADAARVARCVVDAGWVRPTDGRPGAA